MRVVAKAHQDRSLHSFQEALDTHRAELIEDPVVHSHLSELYGTLMEQNLARLIEPFSRVEVAHVAQLIELPHDVVEARLSKVGACSCAMLAFSAACGGAWGVIVGMHSRVMRIPEFPMGLKQDLV